MVFTEYTSYIYISKFEIDPVYINTICSRQNQLQAVTATYQREVFSFLDAGVEVSERMARDNS